MRVGRYQSCVNCLHVEISLLMRGGGIARTLSSLLFFFFERRQRNQSVNSFTALLSPNRLQTALAPTSVTCANQSSLMLCVLSVRSRDNLVGGTEWPFETKKKMKWNILSFSRNMHASKNLTAWKNISKYIFLFEDKKKQSCRGKGEKNLWKKRMPPFLRISSLMYLGTHSKPCRGSKCRRQSVSRIAILLLCH